MTKEQAQFERRRAAFFAHLANIESLKSLKEWQKGQLLEEARDVGFTFLPLNEAESDAKKAMEFLNWEQIAKAHPWVRKYINLLLDGKGGFVSLAPLRKFGATEALFQEHNGRLRYRKSIESFEERMIEEFYEILQKGIFPFRRCSVCKKVFAKWKNQKYCSPACTTRGNMVFRKDTRAAYMKEYMKQRREKKK